MLWVKAFHIVFVVAWFAGVFYLPRLFVYHAMLDADDARGNERFKVMERKLFRGIMTPSAVLAIAFGLWLGASMHAFSAGWLQAKLVLVVLLIAYHVACGFMVRSFAHDANRRTHRFYRVFNEVPVLLLVAVVVLVVVKPF